MKRLAAIFAIDVAAYAVMSNHDHVVAHTDEAPALEWTLDTVRTRWTQLFTGPSLVTRYLSPARAEVHQVEIAGMGESVELYRIRC